MLTRDYAGLGGGFGGNGFGEGGFPMERCAIADSLRDGGLVCVVARMLKGWDGKLGRFVKTRTKGLMLGMVQERDRESQKE